MNIPDMPKALQAERAVLGTLLATSTRPGDRQRLLSQLEQSDFWTPDHRHIFGALEHLGANGSAMSVLDHLSALDLLSDGAGGAGIDAQAVSSLALENVVNPDFYAARITDKAIARQGVELALELVEALRSSDDVASTIAEYRTRMMALSAGRETGGAVHIKDCVRDAFAHLEHVYSQGASGLKPGSVSLQNHNLAWEAGDLVILGARPGMG